MPRHLAVICTLIATLLCGIPVSVSADTVIELPVLAAIRQNNLGVFEVLMMWWDKNRTSPQDAQKGQTFHPPTPGAPRRALSQARPQRVRWDRLRSRLRLSKAPTSCSQPQPEP